MQITEKAKREARYFILYCCIGVCGVTADVIVFRAIMMFGLSYLIANAFSVCVGISTNFFLNALFNFQKTDRMVVRFLKFFSVGMCGLLISSVCLYVLISLSGWDAMYSKLRCGGKNGQVRKLKKLGSLLWVM